jgi:hypothetical protein
MGLIIISRPFNLIRISKAKDSNKDMTLEIPFNPAQTLAKLTT